MEATGENIRDEWEIDILQKKLLAFGFSRFAAS
jgi:hypothetical protein